jgi:hypothetical protein
MATQTVQQVTTAIKRICVNRTSPWTLEECQNLLTLSKEYARLRGVRVAPIWRETRFPGWRLYKRIS